MEPQLEVAKSNVTNKQHLLAFESFKKCKSLKSKYYKQQWIHSLCDSKEMYDLLLQFLFIILNANADEFDKNEFNSEECTYLDLINSKLILLLCQADINVVELLSKYTHRLSSCVLNYPPESVECISNPPAETLLSCFDDFFVSKTFKSLQGIFDKNSSFYSYHSYNELESLGYFSYVYDLSATPRNLIESSILKIYEFIKLKFPEKAKLIKTAEWWAHCRPHFMGHQMHYDRYI